MYDDQDILRLIKKIKQHDIKAVFIDECEFESSIKDLVLDKMMPLVEFLWIVPSTQSLEDKTYKEISKKFSFLDLSKNFRNSREVVRMTGLVAEEQSYRYKEGIVMPLSNFPSGCTPTFADSLEDAMREARKRTNEGILIIVEKIDGKDYFDVLNELNENWKSYHSAKDDFKKAGNPYKFLQEGNVLVAEEKTCFGFDWPTVIVIERNNDNTTFHDCNFMLRCTTNLILVRKYEDSDSDSLFDLIQNHLEDMTDEYEDEDSA